MVDWSSLINGGGGSVDRCSLVDRGSLVSGGRVVSLGLRVVSLSRVSDVSDVITVTVSNFVGDSLKT